MMQCRIIAVTGCEAQNSGMKVALCFLIIANHLPKPENGKIILSLHPPNKAYIA
jgi:hypothetical protein